MDINDLTFGVELEFEVPYEAYNNREFIQSMNLPDNIVVRFERYNHATKNHWKLTTDGSLVYGYELVSPILKGEEGLEQIKRILDCLANTSAYIRSNCGFHVHIGVPKEHHKNLEFFKNLVYLYRQFEDNIFDPMMPTSRRGNYNSYCKTFDKTNLNELVFVQNLKNMSYIINDNDRYAKLNLKSFWLHGTVEFRHHSGTLDFIKVKNWIDICRHLVVAALTKKDIVPSLPLKEDLIAHISNVIYSWSGRYSDVYLPFFKNSLDEGMTDEDFGLYVGRGHNGRGNLRQFLKKYSIPYKVYRRNKKVYYKLLYRDYQDETKYDLDTFQNLTSIPMPNIMYIRQRIDNFKAE
jgi:hypothetical protein